MRSQGNLLLDLSSMFFRKYMYGGVAVLTNSTVAGRHDKSDFYVINNS